MLQLGVRLCQACCMVYNHGSLQGASMLHMHGCLRKAHVTYLIPGCQLGHMG